jgi:hypoxanthine phosphoribosyltransferase
MIKKHYYNWQDVENACINIALQMYKDKWRPDYIVGITRGGNVPATILSNMLGVRGEALKVSLRDATGESESNCWMADDAFGIVDEEQRDLFKSRWDVGRRKNILIVDDINDTGATFDWIKQDWQLSCLPDEGSWQTVWHNNVRFATITDNLSSNFNGTVDYSVHEVNKAEQDVWLVYPWETVGQYDA